MYQHQRVLKRNKHDRYLEELCSELKDQYDVIYTHLPLYSKKNRLIGEIDIIGMRADVIDIIEVKCSYRITKARKQLKRVKKHISNWIRSKDIRTKFFCGDAGQMIRIL